MLTVAQGDVLSELLTETRTGHLPNISYKCCRFCKAFGDNDWNSIKTMGKNNVAIYGVAVDEVWIGNRIYCTLVHKTRNYK
jgi:hypothetical protein